MSTDHIFAGLDPALLADLTALISQPMAHANDRALAGLVDDDTISPQMLVAALLCAHVAGLAAAIATAADLTEHGAWSTEALCVRLLGAQLRHMLADPSPEGNV